MRKEDQLKLIRFAREIAKISFIPWHERDKGRLVGGKLTRNFANAEELYDYVINEWIPNQPDHSALMKIFILCEFQLVPFFRIIVSPPPGKKPQDKASNLAA